MSLLANEYRTAVADTTSTGAFLQVALSFNASYMRVANAGTVPIRATFTSTVASTSDAEIRPGESVAWTGGPTSKLGLLTTSTSTDGVDHRRVRVLALGG